MSRRRVVGFYTDEKGKVRPLTEYGFEPPKKSMELKAVDTTPKHVLKERLRKYREEKGDISGPKPLFHYVPDEKQQTMEELTEKVSKQEKKKEEEKGEEKKVEEVLSESEKETAKKMAKGTILSDLATEAERYGLSGGIYLDYFKTRLKYPENLVFKEALDEMQKEGLVEIKEDAVYLTEKGRDHYSRQMLGRAPAEKGKVKVKIKREHDGTYAVYNLTDPNDLIRMYHDYVEVLVALLGIYGFKKEDFDEETIRKLHYLDYGDTMTLSK